MLSSAQKKETRDCNVLRINGIENHIHILFAIAKILSIEKIVEEVKTTSSRWIKNKDPKYKDFYKNMI